MAEEEIYKVKIKADTSEVKKFIKDFQDLNKTLDLTSAANVQLGTKASELGKIIGAVTKSITKDGIEITTTFGMVEGKLKAVTQEAKASQAAIERMNRAASKRSAAEEGQRYLKYANEKAGTLPGSLDDLKKYQRLTEEIRRLIANPKNGLTAQDAINLERAMRGGSKQLHFGPLGDLQRKLVERQKELERVRSLPGLRSDKERDERYRENTAKYIADQIRKHTSSLPSALSPSDKINIDALTGGLAKMAKTADLTKEQFDEVWKDVLTGGKHTFDGVAETARVNAQRILKEYDKLVQTADQRAKLAAGKGAAPGVGSAIDNLTGSIPLKITPRQLQLIDQSKAKIKELVEEARVDFGQFEKIANDVFGGKGVEHLTGYERQIGILAQTIVNQLDKARAAAKKDADAIALSLARATDASEARQGVRDLFTRNSGYAGPRHYAIPTAKDLDKLQPQFAEKVRRELARIEQMVSSGKVTLAQYQAGFQAFANGSATAVSGGAERVRQAMTNIGNAIEQAHRKTSLFQQALSKGWQFVKAQIIIDSIGRMKDQFVTATQQAANLHRQIALIQTLTQEQNISAAEWMSGIKQISNETGQSMESVAKASYEALSQQIVKGRDTFDFVREAAKFSRTTDTPIEDSVTLLSRHLNAFGKDAIQAGEASAKFFKMIDLGQVKGTELAHTLGRTSGLTRALGANFNEVAAILTALTRTQSDFDEASTLVYNLENGLLKPSKELSEVFKKWGDNTGDLAVQHYGLLNVLEKINKEAGYSSAKLAEFFPEIRRTKAANFVKDAMDQIRSDLGQLENAQPVYQGADVLTKNNIGQKLKVELEKIDSMFKTGFQTKMLKFVLGITDAMGGLANVVEKAYIAMVAFAGVWASFKAISTLTAGISMLDKYVTAFAGGPVRSLADALAFASLQGGSLLSSLNAFASSGTFAMLGIGAAIAAIAINIYADQVAWQNFMNEVRADQAELDAARNKTDRKDVADSKQIISDNIDSAKQKIIDASTAAQAEYNKMADAAAKASKAGAEAMKDNFEEMLHDAKRIVADLDSELQRLSEEAKRAGKFISDMPANINARKYDRSLKYNDINVRNAETYAKLHPNATGGLPADIWAQQFDQSAKRMKARIKELQQLSEQQMKSGDFDAVKQTFAQINQLQDQYATKTRKVAIYGHGFYGKFDSGQRYDALVAPGYRKEITKEQERQKALTQAIIAEDKKKAELVRQQVEQQRKMVKVLENQLEFFNKFHPFNEDGTLKDKYESAAQAAKEWTDHVTRALEVAKQFADATKNSFSLLPADEQKQARERFQRNFVDNMSANAQGIAKGGADFNNQLTIAEAMRSIARKRDEDLNAADKLKQAAGKAAERTTVTDELKTAASGEVNNQVNRIKEALTPLTEGFMGLTGRFTRATGLKGPLEKAQEELINATKNLDQTGDFARARTAISGIRGTVQGLGPASLGLKAPPDEKAGVPEQSFEQALQLLEQKVQALEKRAADARGNRNVLTDLVRQSVQLNKDTGQLSGNVQKIGPASGTAAKAFSQSMQQMDSWTKTLGSDLDAVNAKLNQAKSRAGEAVERATVEGAVPSGRWTGGLVGYYASGGAVGYYSDGGSLSDFLAGKYAHGRDTRPIMAEPGEYVVNADSTRKFYSQLRAINSGVDPVGGSHGGTHVGAINVHVNGGDTSAHTLNNIADGINRGIRRGTIKLGNRA